MRVPAEATQALGYEAEAEEAEDADDEVAHGGHDAGRRAGADLGAVLVERHVTDPVTAVLDRPVTADQLEDLGRGRLLGRERGEHGDLLVAGLAG